MRLLTSEGLAYFWGKVRTALSGKQERLTGRAGQLVGFDGSGRAAAMEAEYMTARQVSQAIAEAVTDAMEAVY